MYYCRTAVLFALLLCAPLLPAHAASSLKGTVLIADEAFSLESVLQTVLVEKRPNRVTQFWIVITGDQVRLATKANGMRDRQLARGFDLVRQHGGIIYACEIDMARLGITAGDLLPPAEPVKGWYANAPMTANQKFYVGEDPTRFPVAVTQLRRLRAACSARP